MYSPISRYDKHRIPWLHLRSEAEAGAELGLICTIGAVAVVSIMTYDDGNFNHPGMGFVFVMSR